MTFGEYNTGLYDLVTFIRIYLVQAVIALVRLVGVLWVHLLAAKIWKNECQPYIHSLTQNDKRHHDTLYTVRNREKYLNFSYAPRMPSVIFSSVPGAMSWPAFLEANCQAGRSC